MSSTDDRLLAFVAVYVFLGDYHALLDFVRYMHSKDTNGQLKKSEYVVIAVKDTTYDYEHREKYLMKCKKTLKHDARQNTMSMHFYTIHVITKSVYMTMLSNLVSCNLVSLYSEKIYFILGGKCKK